MQVIIIDDGVNANIIGITNLDLDLEVTEKLDIIQRKQTLNLSHGSICASIIKKVSPQCSIGSLKILDENSHLGTVDQLLKALSWCYDNDIKLINMSLGTVHIENFGKVQKLIAKIMNKGGCIISACNNNNLYTVPACLSSTIGVKTCGGRYSNLFTWNQDYLDNIDCVAQSRHRIWCNKEVLITKEANSYAAPVITGEVANILDERYIQKFSRIKNALYTKKNEGLSKYSLYSLRLDFVYTAVVIGNYSDLDFNLLDFSVTRKVDYAGLDKYVLSESASLIVLPGNSDDKEQLKLLFSFILRNERYIQGIVYIGTMTENLEDLCKKLEIIIWHNKVCLNWSSNVEFSHKSCTIPIISIEGKGKQVVKIAKELSSFFMNNDFAVMSISDDSKCCLYGIDYFEKKLINEELFVYYETYHKCDVLLYISREMDKTRLDLRIVVEYQNLYCMCEERVVFKTVINKDSTKLIYQFILNYFIK